MTVPSTTPAANDPATDPASSAGQGGGDQGQVQQLTTQVADLTQARDALQQKYDAEHQALATTQGQLQEAVESRRGVETELATAQEQIATLNAQAENANTTLEEARTELQGEVDGLTAERDALTLARERDALLMSEFPELIPFEFVEGERNGILSKITAESAEELREAFTSFSDTLKAQGLQTERKILEGVPAGERQTPGATSTPSTVPDIKKAMDEASRNGDAAEFNRLSDLLIKAVPDDWMS